MSAAPVFDAHCHFCRAHLDQVLASYAECGVAGGINLWSPQFPDFGDFLRCCRRRGLERHFVCFYWPDWRLFGSEPEAFVPRLREQMRRYDQLGARGLKVWKNLGMNVRFADNSVAAIDDERLQPVWTTCRDLGWTVALHQADPSATFPGLCKTGLTREEIFERRDRVLAANPDLRFILCHDGNDLEDWRRLARLLERFPLVNADLRRRFAPGQVTADKLDVLERFSSRFYLGVDLGMPLERPPDREWNRRCCYEPLRRDLAALALSPEALARITWENGYRDFLAGD